MLLFMQKRGDMTIAQIVSWTIVLLIGALLIYMFFLQPGESPTDVAMNSLRNIFKQVG